MSTASRIDHGSSQPPASNSTDIVRAHVQALLAAEEQEWKRVQAEIESLSAKGHRIVSGGQTGDDTWEILDYRTGERIEHGNNGLDGYDEATAQLDPKETWVHIDNLDPEPPPLPVTAGIPASLSEVLADWVGSGRTSDQEIADLAGWPVSKVHKLRNGR